MKIISEELNADTLLSLVCLPVKNVKITLGERTKVVLQYTLLATYKSSVT
jgi:hypothetical protein